MTLDSSQSELTVQAIERVLEIARHLADPCALPELLGRVIDAAREVLQADRGSVFLYDDATAELYMVTGTGIESLRFPATQGLAGECATTRAILNIDDCYADPRFNQAIDRQTGYRTHCMIAVPLIGLENKLVGVMQLLNASQGRFSTSAQQIAQALAGQAAVAIQRQQLLEHQQVKLKLERDIAVAKSIQENVLPTQVLSPAGYDIAGFNRPADDTGGDIYDIVNLEALRGQELAADHHSNVVVLLADATGHGIGPALSVTQMRAMFRMGLRLNADLDRLVEEIDYQLHEDLGGIRFVTAFVGVLDVKNHRVDYNSPGQGPLIHYHYQEDTFDMRKASGMPLGVMPDVSRDPVEPFELAPGDLLILLTDGFIEGVRADRKMYGEKRILELIRANRDCEAQILIEKLVASLDTFVDGNHQADDLTAVMVKRLL